MRVWVTAHHQSKNYVLAAIYHGGVTIITHETHTAICRKHARTLFGCLPRHDSDECFEFELTAKHIGRKK